MAKRLTAAEKWDDPWFRKLSPVKKCLWIYMLDRCDCAGVLEWDEEVAQFYIGAKVSLEGFEGRAVPVNGSKLWIPRFIEFQYGCTVADITDTTPVHRGVLRLIRKYDLISAFERVSIEYANPCQRAKDKDKDKVKDKDKDKDVTEIKNLYGEHVLLTGKQYASLCEKLGPDRAAAAIDILDKSIGSKGYKYKSHYHTMFTWVLKELEKREISTPAARQSEEVERVKRFVEKTGGVRK